MQTQDIPKTSPFNISYQYPRSDEFDYETKLERLDLDLTRDIDIASDNGFLVTAFRSIKDGLKDHNGVFSDRYGQTLQDVNPFANRYSCKCGKYQSRFLNGMICDVCGQPVRFVDDNFTYFGWICVKDPYHIIHPNLYKSIAFFIGAQRLDNILNIEDRKDQDGNSIIDPATLRSKDDPYYGIGMMEFYDKFDEIMQFYAKKSPGKAEYYKDIMENRDKVFTQSIPVFTTNLRPYKLDDDTGAFNHEDTNGIYIMMTRIAATLNDDRLHIFRKSKPKNQLLYDLQKKYNELYENIISILSGKKGAIRALFGGRFNFTSRSVIIPDPTLRIDQVKLSYQCLVGLLQQVIINVLKRSYNMSYDRAYKELYFEKKSDHQNPIIVEIINGIIANHDRGIPILINRNPTINYGSLLQMFCVGIGTGYTMAMPLRVLKGLGADFDGDTLNINYIINQDFLRAAEETFNPHNAMLISKNDGYFNNGCNHQRDTLTNANTMIQLSRRNYSPEQLARIQKAVSQ